MSKDKWETVVIVLLTLVIGFWIYVGLVKDDEKPKNTANLQQQSNTLSMEQKFAEQEAEKDALEKNNAERGAFYRKTARQYECGLTYLTFVGEYVEASSIFNPLTLFDKDAGLGSSMNKRLTRFNTSGTTISFSDKYWVYQFNVETKNLYMQGIVHGKVLDEVKKEACRLIKDGDVVIN
jgi:hypothetical protein